MCRKEYCDDGADQCFSSRRGGWWADTGDVFEVKGGSLGDLFDVMFKGEVTVKHVSEVADVWRGRQSCR